MSSANLFYGSAQKRSQRGNAVTKIFVQLRGQVFLGEKEFQQAVIDQFNHRLKSFPPHYNYLDVITYAMKRGWLNVQGSEITVLGPG